jgi:hypothetical protein
VVGSAFTTGSTYPDIQRDFQEDDYDSSVPEEYVAEVGLVDGPVRFRARWVYSRSATSPSLLPDPKSPAITVDNPDQETCLSLQAVVVFREARADMLQAPAVAALLSDQLMGSPIYDPPAQGAPFVQISLSGKLSLLFPTYLKSQSIAANSLTIDWTGPSMRYQADRKFGELTGKIRSLELTEILPQDEGKVSPDLFMPQLR